MIENKTAVLDKAIEINKTFISQLSNHFTPEELLDIIDSIVKMEIRKKEREDEELKVLPL